MSTTQIRIDRDECIACGACWESCPEVFEENPGDGLCQVVQGYRMGDDAAQGEVPDELEGCARDAADDCPVEIIHVQAG